MTLDEILNRARLELSDTHSNKLRDTLHVERDIQHIIIDTEHVLFEIKVWCRGKESRE